MPSLNSRIPRPTERPTSGSPLGPRTTSAMIRTIASSPGPIPNGMVRLLPLPPDGGVQVFDLVDRPSVDAGGQVLPPIVAHDEHNVPLVEFVRDAHRDGRNGTRRDAGEDALLVEQPARP